MEGIIHTVFKSEQYNLKNLENNLKNEIVYIFMPLEKDIISRISEIEDVEKIDNNNYLCRDTNVSSFKFSYVSKEYC